jgi:hypothetical protein
MPPNALFSKYPNRRVRAPRTFSKLSTMTGGKVGLPALLDSVDDWHS